jgi:tetratricopeptide (TPR) repeat protein
VKGLAWNRKVPDAVRLDSEAGPGFYFGIEAETFLHIPAGSYALRAVLDTKEQTGMWRGRIVLTSDVFEIRKQPEQIPKQELLRREYLKGHYARLDEQFDRVEESAKRMLSLNPDSVSAYDLLGDVHAARGQKVTAIRLYQQAIILAQEQRPKESTGEGHGPVWAPPVAIVRKLSELQQSTSE